MATRYYRRVSRINAINCLTDYPSVSRVSRFPRFSKRGSSKGYDISAINYARDLPSLIGL
jgi:hypothetical protein